MMTQRVMLPHGAVACLPDDGCGDVQLATGAGLFMAVGEMTA